MQALVFYNEVADVPELNTPERLERLVACQLALQDAEAAIQICTRVLEAPNLDPAYRSEIMLCLAEMYLRLERGQEARDVVSGMVEGPGEAPPPKERACLTLAVLLMYTWLDCTAEEEHRKRRGAHPGGSCFGSHCANFV